MDSQRAAKTFRAVRLHLRLRQADVAAHVGVSQQHVSDLERGNLGAMTMDEVARLFAALDIWVTLATSWRGGALDRLLDEGHAAVAGQCADMLRSLGWDVLAEVTFSVYGERGSIDLLAWHPATRTLLVIEIKTELASAEETLRQHDMKVRLAPRLCRERFGAAPVGVARLLVIADSSANRARTSRIDPLLKGPYPLRGSLLRRWLAEPAGAMSGSAGGLLFLNTARGGGKKLRPQRVRLTAPRHTADGGVAAQRRG